VFQSYALWPHRTVFENVAAGLKLRGTTSDEIKQRVEKVLGQIGLGHLAKRLPPQLSGGQQQRVAIARAIVTNPTVLLADEPTGNLDTQRSREIMELLVALNRERGITILMVTHESDMAAYARRIVHFVDGRVASDERSAEVAR